MYPLPFFGTGPGEHLPKTFFGNHPFANPRLGGDPSKIRSGELLMVFFLYGAGAETLILATGALAKICPQTRQPKSAVYTCKTKKTEA